MRNLPFFCLQLDLVYKIRCLLLNDKVRFALILDHRLFSWFLYQRFGHVCLSLQFILSLRPTNIIECGVVMKKLKRMHFM